MLPHNYTRLKRYQYSIFIPLILVILDFGSIILLLEQFKFIKLIFNVHEQKYIFLSETMALCWVLAGIVAGYYHVEKIGGITKIPLRTVYTGIIYFCLIYFLVKLRVDNQFEVATLIALCLIKVTLITLIKLSLLGFYRATQRFLSNRKNTIIIGNTVGGRKLSQYFLSHSYLPQNYLGFFDDVFENYINDLPFYLGALDKVKSYCIENNVKEIYYAIDQHEEYFRGLMKFADENFIFLGIIPNLDGVDFERRVDAVLFNDSRIPVITSRKVPLLSTINSYDKRVFDVIFSTFVLFSLSVTVFPVIAMAIKLSSPGPIYFRQLRPGKNNKLFWCYKFRTMRLNNDEQKQATKNDVRITKVGAFLRRTSLDELPQFYNVLKGDMSVVGPRPNLMIHLEQYPKEIEEYSLRHMVTPGITGFAQINGYRGETKETDLMRKRVEHDLIYIENWSFALDLQIIGKTVYNILSGQDKAY